MTKLFDINQQAVADINTVLRNIPGLNTGG